MITSPPPELISPARIFSALPIIEGSSTPLDSADTVSRFNTLFSARLEKSAIRISLFSRMISVIRNRASLRVPSSTVVSSLANSRDSCSYTAFSTPLSPVNSLINGAIIRSLVRLTPVLPSFNPVLNTPPAINPSVKVLRRCSIN